MAKRRTRSSNASDTSKPQKNSGSGALQEHQSPNAAKLVTPEPLVIPEPQKISNIDALLQHQSPNAVRHELIEVENIFDQSTHAAHTRAVNALNNTSSGSIGVKLDSLKDTEEKLAEAKDGPLKDFHTKQREDKLKDLKKEGAEHLKSHGKALEQLEEAKKAITKDVNDATKTLKKQYEVDVQKIKSIKVRDAAHGEQIQAELEAMAKAHEKNLAAVAQAGEKMTQELTTKLEKATEVVSHIEGKTGLKLNDHMNRSTLASLGSSAAKEGNMVSRTWSKAVDNFKQPGSKGIKFARGMGVTAGAIVALSGLKDAGRGLHLFSPKTAEDGKEVPAGMGDIMLGAGKIAGGGAIAVLSATMGGKGGRGI